MVAPTSTCVWNEILERAAKQAEKVGQIVVATIWVHTEAEARRVCGRFAAFGLGWSWNLLPVMGTKVHLVRAWEQPRMSIGWLDDAGYVLLCRPVAEES